MAESIGSACDLIESFSSGLSTNLLLDEAREAADQIRSLDRQQEVDVDVLEPAQTALRLGAMLVETQKHYTADFEDDADVLGSAIWGSSPKSEAVRIKPMASIDS